MFNKNQYVAVVDDGLLWNGLTARVMGYAPGRGADALSPLVRVRLIDTPENRSIIARCRADDYVQTAFEVEWHFREAELQLRYVHPDGSRYSHTEILAVDEAQSQVDEMNDSLSAMGQEPYELLRIWAQDNGIGHTMGVAYLYSPEHGYKTMTTVWDAYGALVAADTFHTTDPSGHRIPDRMRVR